LEDFIDETSRFVFYEFERDFISNNELFKPRKLKEPEQLPNSNEFDFTPYLKRFPILKEEHVKPGCISIIYQSYIKNLLQEERIGTALSYQQVYNSIKKFKGNIGFTKVTVSYLYQFEKWMYNKGRTRTTVGIILRSNNEVHPHMAIAPVQERQSTYWS